MIKKFSELTQAEQAHFKGLMDFIQETQGADMTAKLNMVKNFQLDINDPVVFGFLTSKIPQSGQGLIEINSGSKQVMGLEQQPNLPTTQKEQKPTKSKEMGYANSQHLIVIQNRLLHAISDLTLYERRLILFLSPIVRKQIEENPKNRIFNIYAKDFAKEYGLRGNSVYSELEKIADNIVQKAFFFWYQTENGKAKKGVSWVSECDYIEYEGKVKIKLDDTVIEMLTVFDKSTGNYWTQYQKEWIIKLGVYGIVMLEMVLSSLENKGYYTIEHLREKFDCIESYPDFYNFKRYVIDKAIKEVHKHTPIRIDYEQDKAGRSIKGLVFSFADTRPKELPKPNTKNPKDQNPFINFKMTKKQLSFFANKIKQASGQDIDEIMDELSNVHLQSKHIAFLKVLDFIPTEWYTEEEIKDHLTQEQIDELKQTLKKSAKSQEEQEQIKLEQDFYKILQYAKSFVLVNKDLINRATIEGFYLQQKDYDAIVQLWKERLMDKDGRRQFMGVEEILAQ